MREKNVAKEDNCSYVTDKALRSYCEIQASITYLAASSQYAVSNAISGKGWESNPHKRQQCSHHAPLLVCRWHLQEELRIHV